MKKNRVKKRIRATKKNDSFMARLKLGLEIITEFGLGLRREV